MEKANPKNPRWTIDWPELKPLVVRMLSGDFEMFKQDGNARQAAGNITGGSWHGYTQGQLERWVTKGFETEAIRGLEEFIPPIREKRRFVFGEEGDEFHYDIAAGGGENYMSHFTKRDEIPGLAIDAEIGMSASVDNTVLISYYVWLCRIAYSCEAAGIDTEITLRYGDVGDLMSGHRLHTTVIRVKRENEASDFLSWSAMLSPASFRSLMFVANDLHADARGLVVRNGQGYRNGGGWSVNFEPLTRTLNVSCPFVSHRFPEAEMTNQLRKALAEATQKA